MSPSFLIIALACMCVAQHAASALGEHSGEVSSPEMQAALQMFRCYKDGDIECMEAGAADDCRGHEELLPGSVPDKLETRGKQCVSDLYRDTIKDWEFGEVEHVKWFQGTEEREVAVTMVNTVTHRGTGAAMTAFTASVMRFNGAGKVTEFHEVRDSAFERAALRHKRDAAAAEWLEATRTGDFSKLEGKVAEECVGVEEGPEGVLPWCGKYTGKDCVKSFWAKYGETWDVLGFGDDLQLSGPQDLHSDTYVMTGTFSRRIKPAGAPSRLRALLRRVLWRGARDADVLSSRMAVTLHIDAGGMLTGWSCLHDGMREYLTMKAAGRDVVEAAAKAGSTAK